MELRTERLLLRPFRRDDIVAFAGFATDERYLRFLGEGHPEPTTFVANNLGIDGAWVIELEGRVVGSVFLGDELAFLLDPAVHGRGIATEASRTVIADGFDRRGFTTIGAHAHPDNAASIGALSRLGFRLDADGVFRLARPTTA